MDSFKVITIDGPAASGKSTIACKLARKLGFVHVNSGALYRALAVIAVENGASLEDDETLANLARNTSFCFKLQGDGSTKFFVDGEEFSKRIGSEEVARQASRIAVLPEVREVLSEVQRDVAKQGSVVVEGRDAGTVVFAKASHKFYLDASLEVRARRREREAAENKVVTLEGVRAELRERDHRDSTREIAPQRAARDAVVVDTSDLGIDEVVNSLYETIAHGEGG
ncbi:MAG: (d)CMP kinase [Deltaproteobacteria bacterium]|nr:(d)CMP kinase [Deltaproteobacteria bacterium]